MASSRANAKLKKQAQAIPAKPLGLFGILTAWSVGLAAVGVALYLRFLIIGDAGPQDNVDLTLMVNGGLAFAITLFSCYLLRMPVLRCLPIAAIGVLAGVVGFHNLVHFYPEQFADMFSPSWVEQVVNATPANSIIWRGQTFVM